LLLAIAACQPSSDATWQGWIEADMVFLGPDDSGRIVALAPSEGQEVKAGDFLFAIDSSLQNADVEAAKAAVAQSTARLSRVQNAQQRPEEVAIIEATQRQARAALDFSTAELERVRQLQSRGNATRQQLDQAQSNYDRDRATVENSARQIDVARMSGRIEDIDLSRAAIDQAKAQLTNAEARLARTKVTSPAAGRIEEVYFRAGEIVPPGRPVVSLLPPGNMKVRFFVPEPSLARMKIDAPIVVTCDGCASGLTARVSFVSHQSEFTPPVIYSLEERRKLVFKIEARLDKPELFRVGQPVTVRPLDAP
jgi:HlyD family secretion protein